MERDKEIPRLKQLWVRQGRDFQESLGTRGRDHWGGEDRNRQKMGGNNEGELKYNSWGGKKKSEKNSYFSLKLAG